MASFLRHYGVGDRWYTRTLFSSLSESGFIPTWFQAQAWDRGNRAVLISFREWLHSYFQQLVDELETKYHCSHLFQRVASFLLNRPTMKSNVTCKVLISFREWLHSYFKIKKGLNMRPFSCSHLFQRVASFLHYHGRRHYYRRRRRFSSLSESGFIPTELGLEKTHYNDAIGSHLFQRVASFLHDNVELTGITKIDEFSSLSESGFIPTLWR